MSRFAVLLLVVVACGVKGLPSANEKLEPEERVVGGHIAPDGKFPYQISLRNGNNRHFCGGSIIDAKWVLTAAHCVFGQDENSMFVAVGTNYLNQGGQGYFIKEIICHPSYSEKGNQNDIALLEIAGTIAFNAKVQPVPLANTYAASGVSCVLSGWGLTSYPSQQIPNQLQYINLPTISNAQCKSKLAGYPVTTTNLCTYLAAGKGACKGDSGGPLCCNGSLHGVVSWGIPCASGNPDVFTSVSMYRSWIASKTGF